ncbi:hypothetical protein SISSUDRAFT_519650 [Sistotremastrum suecicum HHB10207 ss-3]|uniref:Uncharacterized protein n=1 Tax=Sistotremastrum suecicum HHB10207 ss-3 TaxID=1314776 RepID=A0A165XYZ8_9AGAM|nr:hypothetical protein SISSUDRAFT_519650 [Sistotremastrum suecicum HHB10207 ss-3]
MWTRIEMGLNRLFKSPDSGYRDRERLEGGLIIHSVEEIERYMSCFEYETTCSQRMEYLRRFRGHASSSLSFPYISFRLHHLSHRNIDIKRFEKLPGRCRFDLKPICRRSYSKLDWTQRKLSRKILEKLTVRVGQMIVNSRLQTPEIRMKGKSSNVRVIESERKVARSVGLFSRLFSTAMTFNLILLFDLDNHECLLDYLVNCP